MQSNFPDNVFFIKIFTILIHKKMKKILAMAQRHAYTEAKEAAKQNGITKHLGAEMNLLQMMNNSSLTSKEALLLRVLYQNNGCFNDLKELSLNIEQATIQSLEWKRTKMLIEDAPLDIRNLALLLFTIYENKENDEAREVFLKYHDLYDINSTKWPEEIEDACQNMAAAIAIYHSTRA